MKIVPSVSAPIYTSSAFILGILLCDNLTPAEQNSLGNWFMMVGQALSTNSAQQQLLNNRNGTSTQYNSHIINDNALEQFKNSAANIKKEVNNIMNTKIF